MILSTDAPDELLYDGVIPGAFTGDGCVLENVEEVPTGPWMAIAVGTAGCDDPETLAAVEERVYGKQGAAAKTAAELRREFRGALNRCDPVGAQQRARRARDHADVALYPDEDGMADVVVHAP